MMTQELQEVFEYFRLAGPVDAVQSFGSGHIHDTYLLTCKGTARHQYILQKFNHRVFKDPEKVMENIHRVIEHIQNKPSAQKKHLQSLTIIPTCSGSRILQIDKESYWRVFKYIDHSYSIDKVTQPVEATEAALAFGLFLDLLRDMNVYQLHRTIENFHHVGKRFEQLEQSISKDPLKRVQDNPMEISFAKSRKNQVRFLSSLIDGDSLPLRVTHNDTKINNVLFQENSTTGICVVDLDTIMPGYLMYDFGDMARTFCNPLNEDDPAQGVSFRMEIFEALCEGFFKGFGQGMDRLEIESLVYAPWLMTFIMGIRFLGDYFGGDIYYKISYPSHNLDRARNQFKLVQEIERKQKDITSVIHRWAV